MCSTSHIDIINLTEQQNNNVYSSCNACVCVCVCVCVYVCACWLVMLHTFYSWVVPIISHPIIIELTHYL